MGAPSSAFWAAMVERDVTPSFTADVMSLVATDEPDLLLAEYATVAAMTTVKELTRLALVMTAWATEPGSAGFFSDGYSELIDRFRSRYGLAPLSGSLPDRTLDHFHAAGVGPNPSRAAELDVAGASAFAAHWNMVGPRRPRSIRVRHARNRVQQATQTDDNHRRDRSRRMVGSGDSRSKHEPRRLHCGIIDDRRAVRALSRRLGPRRRHAGPWRARQRARRDRNSHTDRDRSARGRSTRERQHRSTARHRHNHRSGSSRTRGTLRGDLGSSGLGCTSLRLRWPRTRLRGRCSVGLSAVYRNCPLAANGRSSPL